MRELGSCDAASMQQVSAIGFHDLPWRNTSSRPEALSADLLLAVLFSAA